MNFRQQLQEAYEAGYNSINEQKKEVPDNIKTIAGELDKAVKAHTSQAKRLRAAGYDTDEDLPKEVRDIPKELDAAVKMHKSQAERLRKAGLSEAFEAGYRSGLNEQSAGSGAAPPFQPPFVNSSRKARSRRATFIRKMMNLFKNLAGGPVGPGLD